jgi:hypothetical protein
MFENSPNLVALLPLLLSLLRSSSFAALQIDFVTFYRRCISKTNFGGGGLIKLSGRPETFENLLQPGMPDGIFFKPNIQIWVTLGESCNGRCWFILWQYGILMAI